MNGEVTRRDSTGEYTGEGQLGVPVDVETGLRILTIKGAKTLHQSRAVVFLFRRPSAGSRLLGDHGAPDG